MAKIGETQLKAQIKSGEYENAYLIYGEESYLKDFYVNLMRKKIVEPAFETFNFHQYEGKDSSLDDILKDAQMLPMMGGYNFVLVRDYQLEKNKNDINQIEEYLSDAPDTTVIVFLYNAVSPDVKSASFKKIISAFDKAGAVVNLEKRSEQDIVKLLVSGAKKRGSSICSSNASYLICVSGNDMTVLLNELDKLSNFAGGGEITKEIIDNMATKCLQARVYDLSKAVVSGNSDNAYMSLNSLFSMKEDPILMTAVIGGVYVDMYRVKCAKTAGYSFDDVAKHYNYKGREFALRNASRDCAALTEMQLRQSLDEIIETDVKLKSTATDKKLLVEELIAKLLLIARGVSYA